jgi:cytochrome c553
LQAVDKMKKILLTMVVLIFTGAAGAFLFAWSGIYSVAASRGHWPTTAWILEFGMRNSVARHAIGIDVPPLTDPALIERGAGHFQGGCAPCHGAPGIRPDPVAQHMLPHPPDLSAAVPTWRTQQLFWIVKHGLKYTGMPAWPAPTRDDEIWAVVAFLGRLPRLSPDEYSRLALLNDPKQEESAGLITTAGQMKGDPIACARCHGLQGAGSEFGGIPRLAGQRPDYLVMAMQDYALGTRPSGIMHPVAAYLTDEEKQNLARHYASLATSSDAPSEVASPDPVLLQLGTEIAQQGVPALSIPACAGCHGAQGRAEDMDPRYPALAGQRFEYLQQQLKLWRAGERGGTFDSIMSMVVRGLTDRQLRAVALYYASLPVR